MCTHNGARYVGDQIHSILAQTRLPDEIVLSDDASSDDTVAIVRAAVSAFPQIVFRFFENTPALQVTKNFEQAVLACTSELIALSDQDDVWAPDRLEKICQVFAARPELLLVHSDARLVDGDGRPLGETLFNALEITSAELAAIDDGRALDVLMRRNVVTGATTVFRRSLRDDAAPFPIGWVHDEWLAVTAAITGEVAVLREQLIDYRQHGSNQIGATKLSVLQKAQMLGIPREARNRRLVLRAESLSERLQEFNYSGPLSRDQVALTVHGKLDHETARYALPIGRFRRLVPIARLVINGGYKRYSRGIRDALRDLVQPAE